MVSLLLPAFSSAFLRGLHTTSLATRRTSRSYSQAECVPSSKVTCKVPRKPVKKIENGGGVSGNHRLHHQLAVSVEHRYRDGALVDIEADILDAIHRVFLSSGLVYCFSTATITYFERGALL